MEIVRLTGESFTEEALDGFIRCREVNKVYRKIDGEYKTVDLAFTDDWSPERKREKAREILFGDYVTYGAFNGKRVVGEMMLCKSLNKNRVVISSFHVSADHRRQGIGRLLFDAAKEYAENLGARALFPPAVHMRRYSFTMPWAVSCQKTQSKSSPWTSRMTFDLNVNYGRRNE